MARTVSGQLAKGPRPPGLQGAAILPLCTQGLGCRATASEAKATARP